MNVEIFGETKLLGLIADPVVQARSPSMANTLLQQRQQFGAFVLLPLHVSAEALPDVTTALRQVQNFAGAIVSMPHKSTIVTLIDDITPEARLAGAVNVIRRTPDARLIGTMLDGEGFVEGLRSAGRKVMGTDCLLVGAGGAASAIAFALAKHGCATLTIINRTATKATALATRVHEAYPGVQVQSGDTPGGTFDLAINATSVGMNDEDTLPMSLDIVQRSALVAECVLAPEMTKLLTLAQKHGRAIHTGVPMLAAQMDLMLRFMGVK